MQKIEIFLIKLGKIFDFLDWLPLPAFPSDEKETYDKVYLIISGILALILFIFLSFVIIIKIW